MRPRLIAAATDVIAALKDYSLIGMLGWQDVQQRYKRSKLGAFWLTISMGIMIGTMGVVFGSIFKTPISEFLPFLAIGMIFWSFISTSILEGCQSFIAAQGIIKQLPLPLFTHIARILWRNTVVLAHNVIIFPLVVLAVGHPLTWLALMSIPGFLLLMINLAWLALLLGIVCARYRDLPQIIGSALQIVFYLTPIMWMPSSLSHRAGVYLVNYNPIYHLLQVVRAPLLGQLATDINWMVSLGVACGGWLLAMTLYSLYRHRIAYWL